MPPDLFTGYGYNPAICLKSFNIAKLLQKTYIFSNRTRLTIKTFIKYFDTVLKLHTYCNNVMKITVQKKVLFIF